MQIRVNEDSKEFGKCGCGRSPTGKCIGWHGLTEEMYAHQKMLWMEEEMKLTPSPQLVQLVKNSQNLAAKLDGGAEE